MKKAESTVVREVPLLRAKKHYDITLVSVVGPPDHPVLRAKWCYRKKGRQCPNHPSVRRVRGRTIAA